MAQVDEAEKEASEVLHSLLSVERIEKQEVILESPENESPSSQSFPSNPANASEVGENDAQMQWSAPVALTAHSIFSTIEGNTHFQQNQIEDQQVVVQYPLIISSEDFCTLKNVLEILYLLDTFYYLYNISSVFSNFLNIKNH